MGKLIQFALLLSLAASAHATTYHIRTDGGTATQCTGTANAPYPGMGSGLACAFAHPFWLVTFGGSVPVWTALTSGDTVHFEKDASGNIGSYPIGQGPQFSIGQNWGSWCAANLAACTFPPPPDNTTWLGSNAGNCTNGPYDVLTGINGVFSLLDTTGAQNIDIECIEITQPGHCSSVLPHYFNITQTQAAGGFATYTYTFGGQTQNPPIVGEIISVASTTNDGGAFNIISNNSIQYVVTAQSGTYASGTFTIALALGTVAPQAETGTATWGAYCGGALNAAPWPYAFANYGLIFEDANGAQGVSNSTFKDLYIHGIANSCTLGSKFNRSSGNTMTFTNIKIYGCGNTGLNADPGGCNISCESQGMLNLTSIDSEWNGCIQISPGIYGYCTDQAFGGNGDNLVIIATGGTWNWNHVTTKWGMQDCFDSLHTGDDPSNLPTINGNYIYSEGCEGQSIKGSGGNVTIRNSIGISNCKVMQTPGNFPSNPSGWNVLLGSPCRANDGMVFTVSNGHTLTLQNVNNIGQQTTGWDILSNGAGCTNSTCLMIFQNNATLGFPTGSGQNMSAIFFNSLGVMPTGTFSNNSYFNINGGCPNVSGETAQQCGDPMFVAESNVNAINANLLADSPLIGNGTALIAGTSPDFNGCMRPSPEAIGYVEYTCIYLTGTTFVNATFSGVTAP